MGTPAPDHRLPLPYPRGSHRDGHLGGRPDCRNSGLLGVVPRPFKSFLDVIGNDALTGKPVLATATAGTARHSLALKHALRPLLAYLPAIVVPTAVYAGREDWGGNGVRSRSRSPTGLRGRRVGWPAARASRFRRPDDGGRRHRRTVRGAAPMRADTARHRARLLAAAAGPVAKDGVKHVTADAVARAAPMGKGQMRGGPSSAADSRGAEPGSRLPVPRSGLYAGQLRPSDLRIDCFRRSTRC
ncbi:NAD(P)H-dependent oxidoreductase [Streptomyces sp. NBC_01622]|uniref:NAD(P)H-dependent oxidoreductase n=1 Tax=Streptomyces sp. NBC_01622 TaxID=2975903 RepID=UPI0038671E35